MKAILLVMSLFASASMAQTLQRNDGPEDRIPFRLKNTLGYHRMFLVEGPGIRYGFTMDRRETVPCNWPVGSRLYFTKDGETAQELIFTLTAADRGKTLGTDVGEPNPRAPSAPATSASGIAKPAEVTVFLRNNRLSWQRIALVSYRPDETGNGTSVFRLLPFGVRRVRFPVETKLYLASQKQIDVVMSGQRIDTSQPFLTLKKQDGYQVFNLFE